VSAIAFSIKDKMLAALGEALSDDLSIEGVRKYFWPVLECSVGGDGGGAPIIVTLGDDLEGELCLSGVHGEDGEVVDEEKVCADKAAHGALQAAVLLGASELVEHLWRTDEDDAASGLAGPPGERTRQEGLAGAGMADEERIDAAL